MLRWPLVGVVLTMVAFISWQCQNMDKLNMLTVAPMEGQKSLTRNVVKEGATVPTQTFGSGCPQAAIQNRGVYANSSSSQSAWDNVLLMTGSNTGYYDMLQNWEYLAAVHGLKWAVAAFDDDLFQKLGPNRSIPTLAEVAVKEEAAYRQAGFSTLTCNKFRMALQVMEQCELDVVFADSDAVFLKDPFAHDLGHLILSGDYEYIYQINVSPKESNTPGTFIAMGEGSRHPERKFMKEGNTGFHFLSHKSSLLKKVILETLNRCSQPDNKIDDQTLFWSSLKKRPLRQCHQSRPGSPFVYNSKSLDANVTESENIVSMCYLDPYYYPTGKKPFQEQRQKDMVVFHANYVRGKQAKIAKLKNDTWAGYGWDDSRVTI